MNHLGPKHLFCILEKLFLGNYEDHKQEEALAVKWPPQKEKLRIKECKSQRKKKKKNAKKGKKGKKGKIKNQNQRKSLLGLNTKN